VFLLGLWEPGNGRESKPAKHHQDTNLCLNHKGSLKMHSFVLFSVFHHQVSCQMQDKVIGEGCAAVVPWQDVRAPISAVLAAKRLDHSLRPFSSLPWSKHMNLN
jgi:hypothetical protein